MSNVQVKYSLLDTEVKFNKHQTGIIYKQYALKSAHHIVDPLHPFYPVLQPPSPLVTTNLFSVSISLFLFYFVPLDST